MQRRKNWWVGMLAAMPFVWAAAGFAALDQAPPADRSATLVVAQFMPQNNL
ncbi:MAG: hypothetical protein FJZ01_05270 [Candidatus Sericytochromatia bacterium]|nr:hypothetical protein [Candidatus Tanganyikabacteria bacterium]